MRRKMRRGKAEAGLTRGFGLWAGSTMSTLHSNFGPHPASSLCLGLGLPFGPKTVSSNCSSLCLCTSLNNPLIILGKKVFPFLSNHSFGLTAPLLCFGWSRLSCITWYMPIESVLIWNRFRKKLFCHLYVPKYYMSPKAEEKSFASIFLLCYVFH